MWLEALERVTEFTLLSALSLLDRSIRAIDFIAPEFSILGRSPPMLAQAAEIVQQCLKLGAEIVYPYHPRYPHEFYLLDEPPCFLSVIGNIPSRVSHAVFSVVGTREPSQRAVSWMQTELSAYLDRNPRAVVVSGGARGIDHTAHMAAVHARRPTVVFLPSGLMAAYPAGIEDQFQPIVDGGGAIVSRYAPTQIVRRMHFEGRNRLIAALGKSLFVVEAKRRSGSLMTARLATELGRDVAALPSFPGDLTGSGTLDLICNGATVIRDALDLEAFIARNDVKTILDPSSAESPDGSDREEKVC